MIGKRLQASVLSSVLIPNINREMFRELKLPEDHRSIGIITCDNDDSIYIGLDDATKKANVHVAYAESTYGGGSCAWSRYGGEIIGMLSGPRPEDVKSGLNAVEDFVNNHCSLYSVMEDDSICYYSYCISKIGTYFAENYNLPVGCSASYLASAPLEAMYGLDIALKAADVKIAGFWGPPTVTNCGGALITGTQSACKAAAEAFGNAVYEAAYKTKVNIR